MNVKALGAPIHTVSIVAAAYGLDAIGNPMIYAVSCGKTATLHVIDLYAGRSVRSFEMEGSTHCWGVVRLPDGTVYMSSAQGSLYRLSAGADAIENLGKPIESEAFLWNLASDERGVIYGGTWSNGKAYAYDPELERFRSYGQIVEGEQYARSVAVADGTLYVGIGTVHAHLVAVDAATGVKKEISLPEGCEQEQTVYDVTCIGPYVFARLSTTNTLLVYDRVAGVWTDRISGCIGWNVSLPHPETGQVYFVKNNRLFGYDPVTREGVYSSWEMEQAGRDYLWIRWRDQELHPGWSLLSVLPDGNCFVYSPVNDRGSLIETIVPGQPNKIQSLTLDSNNRLFIGGFFAGGTAMYDPEGDNLTEYGTVGQPEGLVEHQGRIYMGIYSHAILYRFDPSLPWEKNVNPAKLFSLKDQGQDRPFGLVSAGDRLAIGTVPTYGQHGGALTMYDPQTGEIDVHRNVLEFHSIVCLTFLDGLIYGGTSIHGGLGTVPQAAEGKLFIWDPLTKTKVWDGVPASGDTAVFALAADYQGSLWGVSVSHLFQFDLASRQVTRLVSLADYIPEETRTGWHGWHAGDVWCTGDGYIYGTLLGSLFRFEVLTGEITLLQEHVGHAIGDAAGRIYFTRGTELFLMA